MKVQQVLQGGCEAAFVLLQLTAASADAFPPLKSVAGGALHIAETVVKFKSNKEAWAAFGQYVKDATACIIKALPESSETREDLKSSIEKLRDSFLQIQQNIQTVRDELGMKRVWTFIKDPEKIAVMRKEFDGALSLFHLTFTITTGLDVAKVLDGVNMEQLLERVNGNLSDKIVTSIRTSSALNALPCADGASWDPGRVCLSGTRVILLENIWRWIKSPDVTGTVKVFWLTGVAGAGKTAVAHTVAKLCHQEGILASCFCFDRNVAGRNEPKKLFSTIARGLASLNVDVAEQIVDAIERDQSVTTAPISRQFEELIRRPSIRFSGHKPVVVIIDALDEGYNDDLLSILRDMIPTLPDMFRIFFTSRPEDEIVMSLSSTDHIRLVNMDIHEQSNLDDIAIYVRDRMQDIALRKHLTQNWPGEQRIIEFTERAGGLFVWVYTVSRYLRKATHPDRKLASLLSKRGGSGLPAEEKIDELYSTILHACDWSDEDFAEGYGLFFGAIMAAKTPLSVSALQSLHRTTTTLQVKEVLGVLGPLLTGLTNRNQPVRILHISLREFLTYRARYSPGRERFSLNEAEHSQRLALLCLLTLNQDLKHDIPGTGYLSSPISDPISHVDVIPEIPENLISEELWYACRFWIDHIVEVKAPTLALINPLRIFLSTKLIVWVEVTTSKGRFSMQSKLQNWLQETLGNEANLMAAIASPDLARSLQRLSELLSNVDRKEEAMQTAQQAVQLYRLLAAGCGDRFNPDLSKSLHTLSSCLDELGRREDALESIQQAVELRRQLAVDCPVVFNTDLARSLNQFSLRLLDVGRREDALESNQQAVKLCRQLAAEDPVSSNPELARSLRNLSVCLFNLGRTADALESNQQAVVLFQQLAAGHPAEFNPDLARSLSNFSTFLSNLGRQEAALESILQAVTLDRQLAKTHPTKFNPVLAGSLNNLSLRLSAVGRQDEALDSIRQAVELYRLLVDDRPAKFNPKLAMCFCNLSMYLMKLGHREDALESIQQAVKLRRHLAEDCPAKFNPDLAMSLSILSSRLSDLSHREDALESAQRAVALFRQLAEDGHSLFNEYFACSLCILSQCLSDLGRREDALQPIQQAVTLYRQLAADLPAVLNPYFAQSLNNLSLRLSDLGRREDALEPIHQAITLHQQLAAENPAKFNHDFAASLNVFSKCLSDLGRREDALRSIQQAVTLYQQLAADCPARFNPYLAKSLTRLSLCLSHLGRRDDALVSIRQAVELCRQLVAERPAVFNAYLAESLNHLSQCLSDLGRREDALEAVEQAVKLRQQLAEDCPTKFNPDLAESLDNLSKCLYGLSRREDALHSIREAVELRRQLAADHAVFEHDLAASLNNLANCLSELGCREDALKVYQERNILLSS